MPLPYQTRSLTIRAAVPDDVEAYIDLFNPVNTVHIGKLDYRKTHAPERILAAFERYNKGIAEGTSCHIVIIETATGELVGEGGIIGFDRESSKGEAGIVIDSSRHGKGYGVESMLSFFAAGFEEKGVEIMETGTADGNLAMRGMMEKVFKIEREERVHEGPDGPSSDSWYVIHKAAWRDVETRVEAWLAARAAR
ncbi:acyl-CoA N-acyltransferase [Mycena floridula]|nr:acyl-CoA N-acyltransferase [Mycena floridula]